MSDTSATATTSIAATVSTDESAPARPLIQLLNQDTGTDPGGCCGGGSCAI